MQPNLSVDSAAPVPPWRRGRAAQRRAAVPAGMTSAQRPARTVRPISLPITQMSPRQLERRGQGAGLQSAPGPGDHGLGPAAPRLLQPGRHLHTKRSARSRHAPPACAPPTVTSAPRRTPCASARPSCCCWRRWRAAHAPPAACRVSRGVPPGGGLARRRQAAAAVWIPFCAAPFNLSCSQSHSPHATCSHGRSASGGASRRRRAGEGLHAAVSTCGVWRVQQAWPPPGALGSVSRHLRNTHPPGCSVTQGAF